MADVEIEEAIGVCVEERGTGTPAGIFRARGGLLKAAVAHVHEDDIRAVAGDQDVTKPIRVDVGNGDAVGIATMGEACVLGHVAECPVAKITEAAVGVGGGGGVERKVVACREEDVDLAVVVVVQRGQATAVC